MPAKKKSRTSRGERVRRAKQHEQSSFGSSVERLLYSRAQTAFALGGVSIATVQRIENKKLLEKIRPTGSPNGAVFHSVTQVQALARRQSKQ